MAKGNLVRRLRRIHEVGLTTLGLAATAAQRDVLPGAVLPRPGPRPDPVDGRLPDEQLRPRRPPTGKSGWGKPGRSRADGEVEPLYGPSYLPRKLKVAIGLPGDNCVDLYAQDMGLMALCENFQVVGYNVLVGGGMGMTPRQEEHLPRPGPPLAMIRPEQMLDVVAAILTRVPRLRQPLRPPPGAIEVPHGRLGTGEVQGPGRGPLGISAGPAATDEVWDIDDHVGWHEQGDGRWFYGLHVASRPDRRRRAELRLKSAPAGNLPPLPAAVGLTPGQGILFCDVPLENRAGIEDLLRRHGVKLGTRAFRRPPLGAGLRRPAHLLPGRHRERAGAARSCWTSWKPNWPSWAWPASASRSVSTGCANGCARPYSAELGLVGRAAGRYAIYVGGRRLGTRLGFLYQEGVPWSGSFPPWCRCWPPSSRIAAKAKLSAISATVRAARICVNHCYTINEMATDRMTRRQAILGATIAVAVAMFIPRSMFGGEVQAAAEIVLFPDAKDKPSIFVYLPEASKRTGAALVICPGQRLGNLSIGCEGHDRRPAGSPPRHRGNRAQVSLAEPTLKSAHGDPLEDAHAASAGTVATGGPLGHRSAAGGHPGLFRRRLPRSTAGPRIWTPTRGRNSLLIYPVIADGRAHPRRSADRAGRPRSALVTLHSGYPNYMSRTDPADICPASDDRWRQCAEQRGLLRGLAQSRRARRASRLHRGDHGLKGGRGWGFWRPQSQHLQHLAAARPGMDAAARPAGGEIVVSGTLRVPFARRHPECAGYADRAHPRPWADILAVEP